MATRERDSLRRLRKYEFFDGMYSRNGAGCDFRGSGMALPPGTDHWKLDFDTGKVVCADFVKMMRKKKESQDVFYGLVW